jgi:hypothetical protein
MALRVARSVTGAAETGAATGIGVAMGAATGSLASDASFAFACLRNELTGYSLTSHR